MTKAPNESEQGHARKIELQKLQDIRQLTMPELLELRDLTRAAISHLTFSNLKGK